MDVEKGNEYHRRKGKHKGRKWREKEDDRTVVSGKPKEALARCLLPGCREALRCLGKEAKDLSPLPFLPARSNREVKRKAHPVF